MTSAPDLTHWHDEEAAAFALRSIEAAESSAAQAAPAIQHMLTRLDALAVTAPKTLRFRARAVRRQAEGGLLPWTDPYALIPVPLPLLSEDVGAWARFGDGEIEFLLRPLTGIAGRAVRLALRDRHGPRPTTPRALSRWQGATDADLAGYFVVVASRPSHFADFDPLTAADFRRIAGKNRAVREWAIRTASESGRFRETVPVAPVLRSVAARSLATSGILRGA